MGLWNQKCFRQSANLLRFNVILSFQGAWPLSAPPVIGCKVSSMKDNLTWIDHLNHAQGLANLVTVDAAQGPDRDARDAVAAEARAIDGHIEQGIDKGEAELVAVGVCAESGARYRDLRPRVNHRQLGLCKSEMEARDTQHRIEAVARQ